MNVLKSMIRNLMGSGIGLLLCGQAWAVPPADLAGTLILTERTASSGYEAWDFTYSKPGWATEMFGVLVKPAGDGLRPGVVAAHGKGGNAAGFGVQKAENWFGPENYIVIAPELTHAGDVFCLDSSNECGGSAENVRRVRRAAEILTSQQLIDQLGQIVDRDNLFLYGNSLGALTTIEAAGDLGSRIRAVALSPCRREALLKKASCLICPHPEWRSLRIFSRR